MNQRLPSARTAFTLIELLVVIAIIAVLAGILLPVLGVMRDQGDSVKCARNLGQIGIAMSNYCNENDGTLPGPLSEGQYPRWREGDPKTKGSLVRVLEKYLSSSEEKGKAAGAAPVETVMLCPSWIRVQKATPDTPVYAMNFEDRLDDLDSRVPWGDIDDGTLPVKRALLTSWRITDPKKKINNDAELMNLSQTWAMKDVDKEAYAGSKRQPSFLGEVPSKPVHKDHRNVLFYDFHVGKMKLDDTIQ